MVFDGLSAKITMLSSCLKLISMNTIVGNVEFGDRYEFF